MDDRLFLNFQNYFPVANKLLISGLTGNLIYAKTYLPSQKPREIDVSGLDAGIYFLTLRNKFGNCVQKFVKE